MHRHAAIMAIVPLTINANAIVDMQVINVNTTFVLIDSVMIPRYAQETDNAFHPMNADAEMDTVALHASSLPAMEL